MRFAPNFVRVALCTALLAGCAGQPPAPPSASAPTEPAAAQRTLSVSELLTLANQSEPRQAQRYKLQAAGILAQQERNHEALKLLRSVLVNLLPLADKKQYVFLSSRLSNAVGDGWQALIAINNTGLRLFDQLTPGEQLELRQLRATAYALVGHYEASARERMVLAQLLSGEAAQHNQDALWQALLSIPSEELQTLVEEEPTTVLRGWLELALLRKTEAANLDRLVSQLKQWLSQWHNHPAAQQLPSDLQFLTTLSQQPLQHVAVFLPMRGRLAPAADAIRDGLLAAYFHAREQGARPPQLSFYDTSDNADLSQLYSQAQQAGAELVIGPLAKEKVSELQRLPQLPLPTLALNYGTETDSTTEGLFQYGLSAEDEARQVAEQAWQDGKRRVVALAPSGDWGERVYSAFARHWQQLGGEIADARFYGDNNAELSNSIKQLLDVDDSQNRMRRIRRLLDVPLEFIPRRRQDADWVFLLALPNQARQIKPALAFYFADDLPIYATSHIFSGQLDPSADRDLNGINFCDIPWFLEQSDPLKQQVFELWSQQTVRYGRLYAMGADAFRLAPRLRQLEALPDSKVYGATGALELDEARRIKRNLRWAVIENGRPQLRKRTETIAQTTER